MSKSKVYFKTKEVNKMAIIKGKFESIKAGASQIFVRGNELPINTEVEVTSQYGNIYSAIIIKTHSKVRNGYLYNYTLVDSQPSVADLDELLGLL